MPFQWIAKLWLRLRDLDSGGSARLLLAGRLLLAEVRTQRYPMMNKTDSN